MKSCHANAKQRDLQNDAPSFMAGEAFKVVTGLTTPAMGHYCAQFRRTSENIIKACGGLISVRVMLLVVGVPLFESLPKTQERSTHTLQGANNRKSHYLSG